MASIDAYLEAVIGRAQREAREDGASTVEARHLLLAVAGEPEPVVQGVLVAAGLDRDGILGALQREFEHSLSAVGVSSVAYDLPRPSRLVVRYSLGTSAKLAIERGFSAVTRKKDLRPAHLLLGILSAEVGTVPRALALAGIDRDELTARVRHTLD